MQGTDIYTEDMSFKGLQRRAKETTVNSTGKYNRKSRFCKSIKNHAPASFLGVLNRKLSYKGKTLHIVNTQTSKASQYNHETDEYIKKKLSTRCQYIHNTWIQRDLYSAFLLMNAYDDLTHADREKCLSTYETFVRNHNQCINELKSCNQKLPSSFGIKAA